MEYFSSDPYTNARMEEHELIGSGGLTIRPRGKPKNEELPYWYPRRKRSPSETMLFINYCLALQRAWTDVVLAEHDCADEPAITRLRANFSIAAMLHPPQLTREDVVEAIEVAKRSAEMFALLFRTQQQVRNAVQDRISAASPQSSATIDTSSAPLSSLLL